MKIFSIISECHVDTKMIEILARVSSAGHKHGKGNVSNELENALKNNVALGIVDEDANKGFEPAYFENEFKKEVRKEHNRILKQHTVLKQYLIIICPEIENWLNENATAVNVLLRNYDLPENFNGFKKMCKSKDIRKNFQFDNFIKELIEKQAPGIITLKTWLEDFLTSKELV